jgi:hypothetical protein
LRKNIIRRAAISVAAATAGVIGFGVSQASASEIHIVQPGETLSGIAGSNWAEVAAANGISNPDLIFPGEAIVLDAAAPAPAPAETSTYSAPAPAPAPEPQPVAAPAPASSGGNTVWDRLAQCESSGDWHINTGNGYYGGLQFAQSSWEAAGGTGNPADASREEQIRVAENLLDMQGWGAWPSCSSQLGLR